MQRAHFPWVLLIILIVGFAAFGILGLILAAIGLVVAYFFGVRLHPPGPACWTGGCNGRGEHRGAIFTWAFHRCPGCNGGRLVRWGAGHFGPGKIQDEYRRGIEIRRQAKKDKRWR
jgi:hypothetical protein